MEFVLFMGIQATGKSSFYRQRFFRTHVRVNLDMLKTRHREELLIAACIEGKAPFVVENTNVTREERARYIVPTHHAGFRINGYFFESRTADALERNRLRTELDRIPDVAIFSASKRLELPSILAVFLPGRNVVSACSGGNMKRKATIQSQATPSRHFDNG